MWDAIAKVLTNANALLVLLFLFVFVIIFIILVKTGMVQIRTNNVRVGDDGTKERDVIRQQAEFAHAYIRGIEVGLKIDRSQYGGYKAKYIIELCYNEIQCWIIYNHINLDSSYISVKQEKMKALIHSLDVSSEFRTKEFDKRLDKWVDEIVHKLVMIREAYK